MLHIDGHDTPAVEKAARLARGHGHSRERGCRYDLSRVSIACSDPSTIWSRAPNFPAQWTKERDPFRALEMIQNEYGMRVAAMTLGAHGALARVDGQFIYSPAFVVDCVDTTGAGDVFHGAFCYAVLEGMPMRETLEFSNAMAALNCTAMGARGGIATLAEARALIERARAPRPITTLPPLAHAHDSASIHRARLLDRGLSPAASSPSIRSCFCIRRR